MNESGDYCIVEFPALFSIRSQTRPLDVPDSEILSADTLIVLLPTENPSLSPLGSHYQKVLRVGTGPIMKFQGNLYFHFTG